MGPAIVLSWRHIVQRGAGRLEGSSFRGPHRGRRPDDAQRVDSPSRGGHRDGRRTGGLQQFEIVEHRHRQHDRLAPRRRERRRAGQGRGRDAVGLQGHEPQRRSQVAARGQGQAHRGHLGRPGRQQQLGAVQRRRGRGQGHRVAGRSLRRQVEPVELCPAGAPGHRRPRRRDRPRRHRLRHGQAAADRGQGGPHRRGQPSTASTATTPRPATRPPACTRPTSTSGPRPPTRTSSRSPTAPTRPTTSSPSRRTRRRSSPSTIRSSPSCTGRCRASRT